MADHKVRTAAMAEEYFDFIARAAHDAECSKRALKQIRHHIYLALQGDRNPNRGDLMAIDRMAHDGLKDSE